MLDAETAYLGKAFNYGGTPGRWCCVDVEVVLPDVERFNRLVWAFDVGTCHRFDKVSDLPELVRLADAHRLSQIAVDLEKFIVKEAEL